MRTARHKVPRPRQGERDAEGWRGERQAYPALGEGEFPYHPHPHPGPLPEGEGVSVGPLAPFPGERGRVRGRKMENPLIESRP